MGWLEKAIVYGKKRDIPLILFIGALIIGLGIVHALGSWVSLIALMTVAVVGLIALFIYKPSKEEEEDVDELFESLKKSIKEKNAKTTQESLDKLKIRAINFAKKEDSNSANQCIDYLFEGFRLIFEQEKKFLNEKWLNENFPMVFFEIYDRTDAENYFRVNDHCFSIILKLPEIYEKTEKGEYIKFCWVFYRAKILNLIEEQKIPKADRWLRGIFVLVSNAKEKENRERFFSQMVKTYPELFVNSNRIRNRSSRNGFQDTIVYQFTNLGNTFMEKDIRIVTTYLYNLLEFRKYALNEHKQIEIENSIYAVYQYVIRRASLEDFCSAMPKIRGHLAQNFKIIGLPVFEDLRDIAYTGKNDKAKLAIIELFILAAKTEEPEVVKTIEALIEGKFKTRQEFEKFIWKNWGYTELPDVELKEALEIFNKK